MTQSIRFSSLLFFILIFSILFVSAAPKLIIHSPQAIEYDSTKILLNITSNETVDFFIKDPRGVRNLILAENAIELNSYLYLNEGEHDFTIWANNSHGETNASVIFNTSVHNPVEITSCGFLSSSNTEYILMNDVVGDISGSCLILSNLVNSSVDLNGYDIGIDSIADYRRTIRIYYVSGLELFNGSVGGSAIHQGSEVLELDTSRIKFSNLNISGFIGIRVWSLKDVIFDNVHINSSIGVFHWSASNTYFINSSFVWNGVPGREDCPSSAFCGWADRSEFFLEEVNISNFPENDFIINSGFSDFYLRNTKVVFSKIRYPDTTSDTRFFNQHLILIDVTDQFNESGSGIVEIIDTGEFSRKTGTDALFETLINPTAELLVATERDGTVQIWLTEKLVLARSSSPAVVTEYDFSPYNLTARTWNSNTSAILDLRDVNSTIPVSFQINVPAQLPACTLSQMLDLNNDGSVTIADKNIVTDFINGKNVSTNGTKQCEGINLFSL